MHESLVYGLNIRDDDTSKSVEDILAAVRAYIRDKRNLTLDRYLAVRSFKNPTKSFNL